MVLSASWRCSTLLWIVIGTFLAVVAVLTVFYKKKVKNYENFNEQLIQSNDRARRRRELLRENTLRVDEVHEREFGHNRKNKPESRVNQNKSVAVTVDNKNNELADQQSNVTVISEVAQSNSATNHEDESQHECGTCGAIVEKEESMLFATSTSKYCDFCESLRRRQKHLTKLRQKESEQPVILPVPSIEVHFAGDNKMGNELSNELCPYNKMAINIASLPATGTTEGAPAAASDSTMLSLPEAGIMEVTTAAQELPASGDNITSPSPVPATEVAPAAQVSAEASDSTMLSLPEAGIMEVTTAAQELPASGDNITSPSPVPATEVAPAAQVSAAASDSILPSAPMPAIKTAPVAQALAAENEQITISAPLLSPEKIENMAMPSVSISLKSSDQKQSNEPIAITRASADNGISDEADVNSHVEIDMAEKKLEDGVTNISLSEDNLSSLKPAIAAPRHQSGSSLTTSDENLQAQLNQDSNSEKKLIKRNAVHDPMVQKGNNPDKKFVKKTKIARYEAKRH